MNRKITWIITIYIIFFSQNVKVKIWYDPFLIVCIFSKNNSSFPIKGIGAILQSMSCFYPSIVIYNKYLYLSADNQK